MDILKAFLRSRKFWLAVFAVIQSIVMHYFKVDQTIWMSIDALVSVLITGIAIEDAGTNSNQNNPRITNL